MARLGPPPYPMEFVPSTFVFNSGHSELRLHISDFKLDGAITREIGALGSVTLARQGVVSLSVLLVNNLLFNLGGESAVAVYAIISRLLMFSLFPILGITQGFVPIAAYNYGANNKKRVEHVIRTAVLYASAMASLVFLMIYTFSNSIGTIFTSSLWFWKIPPLPSDGSLQPLRL